MSRNPRSETDPERRNGPPGLQIPLSLIYVIGTYPILTTTFIDREIKTLRAWGVELHILAARRPAAGGTLSQDQQALRQGVIYLLPASWGRLILSQLYFVLHQPGRYFQILISLLTQAHPNLQARFKTFLHFGEGVYAAYLVRDLAFQELHAHFADRAATIAMVAGKLLGRPYSLSIHASADIFVQPVLLREKIGASRHVVTCTQFNKSHLEAVTGQGFRDKISMIQHGLDLSLYRPSPSEAGLIPRILSVGQLVERKGFAQLLRACQILKDQRYGFTCEIVGQGPQRAELETMLHQLSLEGTVTLCGALPHEQVIEKYRQASVFVLPCIQSADGNMDGIPNVLAEAMAMQVPVISTNVSAIPEFVRDQENGLLVPPGDADALAAAIARLLVMPELRGKLGKAGRQTVLETFDLEQNVRVFARTLWPECFPS